MKTPDATCAARLQAAAQARPITETAAGGDPPRAAAPPHTDPPLSAPQAPLEQSLEDCDARDLLELSRDEIDVLTSTGC
jgi:hypothetical protein